MNFSNQVLEVPVEINENTNPALLQTEIHLSCILLVDDDRATNFLNKRLLEKMGVVDTINIARNGVEAMEYLTSAAKGERDKPVPELIFLDINMPIVNGWEFLERYESMPEDFKQSITVLMLSTSLRQADIEQAGKWNVVKGFIHKPLTSEQVMKVLDENFG